ncbi:type II toxin-antitoxin system RelE/ParE family toxin [Oceanicoccus sp. KOV_DT_Chl]|uniref:type II toxin-antitoxin system RelE/ParE family toxin n=1 Tax=Oceanicoccus sp. KOV_DT_Chl TaxID=1904639 RepID=UPI000C7A2606|nr:type II toxin-antitoxin system RelE/ParE family toxin [Oceanicoccus sp. KOV_DT_Chl]
MAKVMPRIIREYIQPSGRKPFRDWLLSLKDAKARVKLTIAIRRMETGHFGDTKALGDGLQEHRLFYGPGYRIYYTLEKDEIIILFAGSSKADQNRAISKAKQYLTEYKKGGSHAPYTRF